MGKISYIQFQKRLTSDDFFYFSACSIMSSCLICVNCRDPASISMKNRFQIKMVKTYFVTKIMRTIKFKASSDKNRIGEI